MLCVLHFHKKTTANKECLHPTLKPSHSAARELHIYFFMIGMARAAKCFNTIYPFSFPVLLAMLAVWLEGKAASWVGPLQPELS